MGENTQKAVEEESVEQEVINEEGVLEETPEQEPDVQEAGELDANANDGISYVEARKRTFDAVLNQLDPTEVDGVIARALLSPIKFREYDNIGLKYVYKTPYENPTQLMIFTSIIELNMPQFPPELFGAKEPCDNDSIIRTLNLFAIHPDPLVKEQLFYLVDALQHEGFIFKTASIRELGEEFSSHINDLEQSVFPLIKMENSATGEVVYCITEPTSKVTQQ